MLRGCLVGVAIILVLVALVVGVVTVRTWIPLQEADRSLEQLDLALGPDTTYTPTGSIPEDRLELFLKIRGTLATGCDAYGRVRAGSDAVDRMDSSDTVQAKDIAGASKALGGAALSITPFLARFLEMRNRALLAARMSLEEYSYIYALAYHERLLSPETRAEIFSNGEALSPEASKMLARCLAREATSAEHGAVDPSRAAALEAELERMSAAERPRLIWQDGIPDAIRADLAPYRDRLDRLFCPATAGLEMEGSAGRALRIALY